MVDKSLSVVVSFYENDSFINKVSTDEFRNQFDENIKSDFLDNLIYLYNQENKQLNKKVKLEIFQRQSKKWVKVG